jgi:hypothetical protein
MLLPKSRHLPVAAAKSNALPDHAFKGKLIGVTL